MDKPNLQYGFDEANSIGRGPGGADEPPMPTIDFYGAMWRRKSVIVLLSVLGAAVACLIYTQVTPVYASVMRLMLFVQAPPSVINGEVVPQTVSLEKHRVLLSGQTVLAEAVRNGQLDKLSTFSGADSPIVDLRKMLTISPVGKDLSSDALEIICDGTVKEDLPGILNQVVASYISAIEKDSEISGKESVELIERLQRSLVDDQKVDQDRYYQLLKELNLTAENDKGRWVNPYVSEIEKLRLERDDIVQKFRDSDQQLEQVRTAMDPENKRDELLRLAVIEGRKYFNLDKQDRGMDFLNGMSEEDRLRLIRYEQRMEVANAEVVAMDSERAEAQSRYGAKHPQVEFVEAKYQASVATRNRLSQELETLRGFLNKERELEKKGGELSKSARNADSELVQSFADALSKEVRTRDSDILQLYAAALANERERAKYNMDRIAEDITELTNKSAVIAGDITELNMLRDQIEERRNTVGQILEKLSAMRAMSNSYSSTRVKIIDEASFPLQVFPKLWKFLLAGLSLGGLLGCGLAVLIDHSDLAYRTPIDIQENLNTPVLCKIPRIKKSKLPDGFAGSPMLVATHQPNSSVSESFRAARTSLLFTAAQNGGKVFMFTSPSPGDGKSTTIANLAISLAQTNKRVCLVDCDYRRPRVQQNFGVQFEPGGMQYLEGECSLEQAARACEFQKNLWLVTTGGRPKNPGELVASASFVEFISELRNRFDFVLIDSPPVIPVADATSICGLVDGIIMVLRIRRGVVLSAHKAKSRLSMVNGNLIGVIVNGMDENLYYNEYGTYYRGAYHNGYSYRKYYDKKYSDYSDRVRSEDRAAS
jgi:polysaccharide biosynthesis transport protein